jgi:hypothetical protein
LFDLISGLLKSKGGALKLIFGLPQKFLSKDPLSINPPTNGRTINK